MSAAGGLRTPPGRAGRLWLRGRLAVAQRGLDLLDRKLRILRREQERLELLARRTGDEWERACRQADTWLLRAALLRGQRSLRLASGGPPAVVTIVWRDTMGIRYPAEATSDAPGQDAPSAPGGAALQRAGAAHRAALAAAVQHAAASAALRTVEAEVAATSQRLRAIQDRWVPHLQVTLAQVELDLDELEHADAAQLRRAINPKASTIGRQP